VYRWTQRYAPEFEKRSAWYRSRLSFSWRVDETYVQVILKSGGSSTGSNLACS
jgi:transposase-like protein